MWHCNLNERERSKLQTIVNLAGLGNNEEETYNGVVFAIAGKKAKRLL